MKNNASENNNRPVCWNRVRELRLLRDEDAASLERAVCAMVGRGVQRPSEIAGRLGVRETTLAKPLRNLGECKWQTHATAKRVAQWMDEVKQRPVPPLGKAGTVHYGLFLPKAPARQEGEVHVFDADMVTK